MCSAAHRVQQEDRSKAVSRSGGGGARAPSGGLHAVLRERRRQISRRIGKGEVAEGREDVGAEAPRRGLQNTLELIRVVGKNVSRRDSAVGSERTRSEKVGVETFVDWQKQKNG